eukprot:m.183186 g.183186  ORF g.183186 m.183186 type:complete len:337 (-) comp14688_c0_seq6:1949-2959(-)
MAEEASIVVISDDEEEEHAVNDGRDTHTMPVAKKSKRVEEPGPAQSRPVPTTRSDTSQQRTKAATAAAGSSAETDSDSPMMLRVASWNINGLSEQEDLIGLRFRKACIAIVKAKADVVALQEVVPSQVALLSRLLLANGYQKCGDVPELIKGKPHPYFTLTFYKQQPGFKLSHVARIPFPNSIMMRDMLICTFSLGGEAIEVVNLHLESEARFSASRIAQADIVLEHLCDVEFGVAIGDLNIRDREAAQALRPHTGAVQDAWEACGSKKESKFTWDLVLNDTIKFGNGSKPRLRFDRCWFRGFNAKGLQLLGTEESPDVGFISDHFGLLVDLEIPS